MRKIPIARVAPMAITACLCISPLFAGALVLQIENPKGNAEASAKNALVLAHVTECQSPGKTLVTATAEGIIGGQRKSIPVKLIQLSTPGFYAVSRDWTNEAKVGTWAVTLVVTNPDYGKYVTAAIVPVSGEPFKPESVKHVYRVPTAEDIASVLAQNSL